MGEVVIFLFEHFSPAALFLVLGYAADQISTPVLKEYIVKWVRKETHGNVFTHPTNFFRFVLEGFIEPIFGNRIFSLSFFLRSCLVTTIFLIVIFGSQLFVYGLPAFTQLRIVDYSHYVNALLVLAIILSTFVIDYVSNAKSISLLRMAASSGRPSSVILIFMADTTLTIAIFSILFSSALSLFLMIEEPFRPAVHVKIAPVSRTLQNLITERSSSPIRKYADLEDRALYLEWVGDETNPSAVRPIVHLFVAKALTNDDTMAAYLSALKASLNVSVLQTDASSRTVAVEFKYPHFWFPILQLSVDMEADANRAEVVWSLVRLDPRLIRFSTIFNRVADLVGPQFLTVVCESGDIANISYRGKDTQIQCPPKLLFVTSGPDVAWPYRIATAAREAFPETPFFLSSFALANLYYAIILLFVCGGFILRAVSYVFSSPYLDTTTKPFTLLSLVLFPIIVLVTSLLSQR
jgi:hypothetical protein